MPELAFDSPSCFVLLTSHDSLYSKNNNGYENPLNYKITKLSRLLIFSFKTAHGFHSSMTKVISLVLLCCFKMYWKAIMQDVRKWRVKKDKGVRGQTPGGVRKKDRYNDSVFPNNIHHTVFLWLSSSFFSLTTLFLSLFHFSRFSHSHISFLFCAGKTRHQNLDCCRWSSYVFTGRSASVLSPIKYVFSEKVVIREF